MRFVLSLSLVLTGALCLGAAEEPAPAVQLPEPLLEPGAFKAPRLLYPANCVVIERKQFECIAVAEGDAAANGEAGALALKVNGETRDWGPFAPPAYAARLELEPGEHHLTLGDAEARFFVKGDGVEAPEEWPVFKTHPIREGAWFDCSQCHTVREGGEDGLKTISPPHIYDDACAECHSRNDFVINHAHTLDPLLDCARCHALHGSTREHLLKAPAKKLCFECHD